MIKTHNLYVYFYKKSEYKKRLKSKDNKKQINKNGG